jgi:hypothetical protein
MQSIPPINKTDRLIAELHEAARRAGIRVDDPMAPLIDALALTIQYLNERSAWSERIITVASRRILQALVQGRETADAEAQRFRTELAVVEAETVQHVSDAIVKTTDAAWSKRISSADRNAVLIAGFFTVAVAVISAIAGNEWGRSRADNTLPQSVPVSQSTFGPEMNSTLKQLMSWNDIRKALAACSEDKVLVQDGRRWCRVGLWIEPSHSAQ